MGLKSELQTDLKEAYDNDLSDAVKSVVLRQRDKAGTVYDPVTGLSNTTYVDYNTRGVFTDYSQLERFNTHILPTDVAFIIIANELQVIPEVKDKLIHESKIYDVNRLEIDPVAATYTLHLRTV